MKKLLSLLLLFSTLLSAKAQSYEPTSENMKAREEFKTRNLAYSFIGDSIPCWEQANGS